MCSGITSTLIMIMAHLHMETEKCYLAWFNELNHLCLAAAQSCLISSHGPGPGTTLCTGSGAVSVLFSQRDSTTYLLILLIASDMCKALWFFVFPLTVLVGGLVSIHSSFSQASGFFFSQATEASDFAVPSCWRFA
jgi:hypothetical protein